MAGAYDDRDGKIWMDGTLVDWRDANVHLLTPRHAFTPPPSSRGSAGLRRHHLQEPRPFRAACRGVRGRHRHADPVDRGRDRAPPRRTSSPQTGSATPLCPRQSPGAARARIWAPVPRAIRSGWPSQPWEWGRLLRRRQDEGREARQLRNGSGPAPRPSPATPRPPSYISWHHVETCREAKGCSDAMIFDYRGYVAEATGANISSSRTARCIPLCDCFLNGITR